MEPSRSTATVSGKMTRARGASSRGDVDCELLDVSATDWRLSSRQDASISRSFEQHLSGLLDRAPTGHDRWPLSQLGHRPAVLVWAEDWG
jgi:hypothetical protein